LEAEKTYTWVISENEIRPAEINIQGLFNDKGELALPDWVVNDPLGRAPVGRRSNPKLKGADFDILRNLYSTLISPIEDWLAKEKTVTFVTNDVLNDVPFGVLLSPQDEFFIEKHPFVITPSIRLLKIVQQLKDTPPLQENPIILAGPDTNNATDAIDLITPLFPDKKTVLKEATLSQIKTELKERSCIHIYSHGTQVQEEHIDGETYKVKAKKDRQDSVFEGALCLHPSGKEGYLYGEDVLESPIDANLVFLSACESGKGATQKEGVIGLPRAFLGAGARSVISTYWKVPEMQTGYIAREFYQNVLQKKMSKPIALQQAMITIMKEGDNRLFPELWGAWFLQGLNT